MNTTSKINNARNNFTDLTKPQFPTADLVSNPGVLQSMQSSLWTSCCFAVWNPDTLRSYQSSLWLGQLMIRVLELPTKIPKLERILQAYLTDTTANINHEPTNPSSMLLPSCLGASTNFQLVSRYATPRGSAQYPWSPPWRPNWCWQSSHD